MSLLNDLRVPVKIAQEQLGRAEIASPIETSDIEVEIIHSTAVKQAERMDTDNIQKPTLDALKGIAYADDAQVSHVDATLFDRNSVGQVNGRVSTSVGGQRFALSCGVGSASTPRWR